jgi:hypothetical protein
VLAVSHGEPTAEHSELHLPRFLGLRTRLRAAFPSLSRVADPLLLALLCAVGGDDDSFTLRYLTGTFAFIRLMEHHPERGDGQATEAERALGKLDYREEYIPEDVGTGRGDSVLPSGPDSYEMRWSHIQGLGYPDLRLRALTSAMQKTASLLEAFHRQAA